MSDLLNEIASIARDYCAIIENSKISDQNPLLASQEKLSIDLNAMRIDASARKILKAIRTIKESRVTDDSYQEERQAFESECLEAAGQIQVTLHDSYALLTNLADEGFDVLQSASKMLRTNNKL